MNIAARTYCPSKVCSLYTAHRSQSKKHAFSAKEKDAETGLSYFGSRYYSSELSIWLSVDPMRDKYPHLSAFTYCANNPVKLVDPNGEEIVISETTDEKGNKIINIKFTATLVDKSNTGISHENMEKYKNDITKGIVNSFSDQKNDGTIVNVDVDIDIQANGELLDPLTSRHTINIVDRLEDQSHAAESLIGGDHMDIRLDICKGDYPESPVDRSAAHEFGHLLGLDHVGESDNIMNPNTKGRAITGTQIWDAYRNYQKGGVNNNICGINIRDERRRQAWKVCNMLGNRCSMKRFSYILYLLILFTMGSCSLSIRNRLPNNYVDLNYKIEKRINNNRNLDKSLCEGQLMMLQIGELFSDDTVSVYISDKLVLNKITTNYSYPYIDKKEYGGNGTHYYDFLLFRNTNRNRWSLINFGDPSKKVLAKVLVKDTLDICVVDEKGNNKRIKIPQKIDHFLEIRFLKYYADTLQGVRLFD